jgi:hypothetical protein
LRTARSTSLGRPAAAVPLLLEPPGALPLPGSLLPGALLLLLPPSSAARSASKSSSSARSRK